MTTIVVAHNPVGEDAPEDERDVLVQVQEVSNALKVLGFDPVSVPFELCGNTFKESMQQLNPACIFNLVESVDGDARLIHLAPAYFDHLGIPFTGASDQAMLITTNKVLSKKLMALNHIPTPAWIVPGHEPVLMPDFPGTYIIKAFWQEASVGIDRASIVTAENPEELEHLIQQRSHQLGFECFAEQYIEGREFNISLLARDGGPCILPVSEIRFHLSEDTPNIVDYQAKWHQESEEYQGTVRCFDFPAHDSTLIEALDSIALACWKCFELKGYNRVDFRVDSQGRPFVLEINANPCISPDSGFVASAQQAGLTYPMIVERILLDAITDKPSPYKSWAY